MKKVNIIPRVNNGEYRTTPIGETVGWIVDEGMVNGRRKRTTFKTKGEAEAYGYKIDVAREAKQVSAVSDLGELMSLRSELLYCHDRLKSVGATFTTAIEYYLTHARSSKGDITVGDSIMLFRKSKKDEGCSDRYIESLDRQHHPRFLLDFPSSNIINKITSEELRNHFYHKRWESWSPVTRTNYIKNISALFSLLVKREYLVENPVLKVDKPRKKDNEVGYLTIPTVKKLLTKASELKWYDRLAVNVLVLFCGIRVEEAAKMTWSNFDLFNGKVTVDASIAKLGQRRINLIPSNALVWLKMCKPIDRSHHNEMIIEGGWEDKLSLLRQKAGINYTNNAARHSFGTYHFAAYENPGLTAVMLGHIRGLQTLYTHYRNVVTKQKGEEYFGILPSPEMIEVSKKHTGKK